MGTHAPDVFKCSAYRDAVEQWLSHPQGGRPRGAIKALADVLKCHPTFIAHVLNGKADFSNEQALRFCRHFALTGDETDFFLDLLNRDRAGDTETRAYFQERLKFRLEERQNLQRRLRVQDALTSDQEAVYFKSWLTQAVHMSTLLPGPHTVASLAARLGAQLPAVEETVKNLVDMGFLQWEKGSLTCVRLMFHLGRSSPWIAKSHYNWRLKTAQTMMETPGSLPGVHYSSVFTLSEETVQEVRELILRHVEEARERIAPSPSERVYVYCIDFYPLFSGS